MGARGRIKPMFTKNKWKILRGDTIQVLSGKDKGAQGTVIKVIRDEQRPRVLVEGVNLHKRHVKRTQDNPGGVIPVEAPIHYSNVSLVDPQTGAPCRVEWRFLEDGTKVRVTKGKRASGTIVARPAILKERRKPLPTQPGPKDTPVDVAQQQSYTPPLPPPPAAAAAGAAASEAAGIGARSFSTMIGALCASCTPLIFGAHPLLAWRRSLGHSVRQRGFAAAGVIGSGFRPNA